METNRRAIRLFFEKLSNHEIIEWKQRYETLLANKSNQVELVQNGKQVIKNKQPYMVETWTLGLEVIHEVLAERLTTITMNTLNDMIKLFKKEHNG